MAGETPPDDLPRHLLKLPNEVRNKIWGFTFSNLAVTPSRSDPQFAQDGCRACNSGARNDDATTTTTENASAAPLTLHEAFRPLLTCKQIYNEAYGMLLPSITLHLGSPLIDSMRLAMLHLEKIEHHIRRLEWRVHIQHDNRLDWIASIGVIGKLFPMLENLVVHAHLRPPNIYEELIDCIYIALPLVRLANRDLPNITLDIDVEYINESYGFRSPLIAEVTAEEARKGHELVIKDLVADEQFIGLSLAPLLRTRAMIDALGRCSTYHEQSWFQQSEKRKAAEHREWYAAQMAEMGMPARG